MRASRTLAPLLLASLLLLTPGPRAGSAPESPAEAPGAVRGSVRVHKRALFGGAEPAEDRSGVVVYLSGFTTPAPPVEASVEQREEQFRPRVLPIVAGQSVSFPNRDPIYHNVFSVSPLQPFDLGQYRSSDPPRSEVFERPGLVPVYCNIHPHMISYVAVLENDAFAVTSRDGSFEIRNAPPGRHLLHAWMPGAERVSLEVEVRAGTVHDVELELVAGPIPRHKRKDGSDYPRPGLEAER
jgi:plastocyanin